MSVKKRQHSPEFKAKVAIAAIKADLTISEICSRYQISPSCLHKWKKEALANIALIFEGNSKSSKSNSDNTDIEKLYAEIGKLKIAKDFLEKKLEG